MARWAEDLTLVFAPADILVDDIVVSGDEGWSEGVGYVLTLF